MPNVPLFRFVSLGGTHRGLNRPHHFTAVKYAPGLSSTLDLAFSEAAPTERRGLLRACAGDRYVRDWPDVGLDKNALKQRMTQAIQAELAGETDGRAEMAALVDAVEPLREARGAIWESLHAAWSGGGAALADVPRQVELLKFDAAASALLAEEKTLVDFESSYTRHVVVLDRTCGPDEPGGQQGPGNDDDAAGLEATPLEGFLDGLAARESALARLQRELGSVRSAADPRTLDVAGLESLAAALGVSAGFKGASARDRVPRREVEEAIESARRANFRAGVTALDARPARTGGPAGLSHYVRRMAVSAEPGGMAVEFSDDLQNPTQDALQGSSDVDGPATDIAEFNTIQFLGQGTLFVVEEELDHYVLVDISYIENVMETERKDRRFLSSTQTDQLEEFETIDSSEVEQDHEISNSYELNTQVSEEISSAFNTGASVSVSGRYGVVSVGTNATFGYSSNSSLSTSSAQSFAQSIVDRSVERVTSQTRQLSSLRITTKVENESSHGFDNTQGNGHVRGIFRWLDKVSNVKLYDYGERAFYQFTVPEPAALHRHYLEGKHVAEDAYLPEYPDFTAEDVLTSNYQELCSTYRVVDVPELPARTIVLGKSVTVPATGEGDVSKTANDYFYNVVSNEIEIPEGYVSDEASVDFTVTNNANTDDNEVIVVVANIREQQTGIGERLTQYHMAFTGLDECTGLLPVTISAYGVAAVSANIVVECRRTSQTLDRWRQDVYEAILAGYESLKLAYDQAVSAAESEASRFELQDLSSTEKGKIIDAELRRSCIDLLTRGTFKDLVSVRQVGDAAPETLPNRASSNGRYIVYFENCFEWDQMVYTFYPYFWSRESQWEGQSLDTDPDELYSNFLSSGEAQVIVPVRPGYEKSLRLYLRSGSVLESLDLPIYDIEDYYDAEDAYHRPDDERVLVDEWQVRYPTELVYVQDADEAASIIQEGWTSAAP